MPVNQVDFVLNQSPVIKSGNKNINVSYCGNRTLERTPNADEYQSGNKSGNGGKIVAGITSALILAAGITAYIKGKGEDGIPKDFLTRMKDGFCEIGENIKGLVGKAEKTEEKIATEIKPLTKEELTKILKSTDEKINNAILENIQENNGILEKILETGKNNPDFVRKIITNGHDGDYIYGCKNILIPEYLLNVIECNNTNPELTDRLLNKMRYHFDGSMFKVVFTMASKDEKFFNEALEAQNMRDQPISGVELCFLCAAFEKDPKRTKDLFQNIRNTTCWTIFDQISKHG